MITMTENRVTVVCPSPGILEDSKGPFNSFLSYRKYRWLMVLPAAGKKDLQIRDDVNKSGRILILLRRFVLYPLTIVSTSKQPYIHIQAILTLYVCTHTTCIYILYIYKYTGHMCAYFSLRWCVEWLNGREDCFSKLRIWLTPEPSLPQAVNVNGWVFPRPSLPTTVISHSL